MRIQNNNNDNNNNDNNIYQKNLKACPELLKTLGV